MAKLPSFGIEKPLQISIVSPQLQEINTSGEYVAQLKLDEHRSFYIFENNTLTVMGWRGNIFHTIDYNGKAEFPDMVLDGGILRTKTFRQQPVFYVFDLLLFEGQKNTMTYMERYNKVVELVGGVDRFVIPRNLDIGVIQEFKNLQAKKSTMVKQIVKEYKGLFDEKTIYEITEGFVLKKKDSKLSYRASDKSYNANQLKLKLKG